MTPKPLLRRPEVEAITHLSRASIYSKMKKGAFPLPVRLGSNSVAWRAEDIHRWISELPVANELRDESRAAAAGQGYSIIVSTMGMAFRVRLALAIQRSLW